MSMTCQTCLKPNVKEINKMLVSGISLRDIASQYDTNHAALFRHKENCIPKLFDKRDNKLRTGLLNDLDSIKTEINDLREEFKSNGLLRDRLIGRKFTAIELEAKLTGQFTQEKENPANTEAIALKLAQTLIDAGHFTDLDTAKNWLQALEADVGEVATIG